jgi:hypothetical protein
MATISNEPTTFIELPHEVFPVVSGEATVTVGAGDQASSLLGQSVGVNLEHNPHQAVPHYQWIRFTVTLLDPLVLLLLLLLPLQTQLRLQLASSCKTGSQRAFNDSLLPELPPGKKASDATKK